MEARGSRQGEEQGHCSEDKESFPSPREVPSSLGLQAISEVASSKMAEVLLV